MSAVLEDGWIKVPYNGPELAKVEIGIGEAAATVWQPAFINTVGSQRFAQVRPMGFLLSQSSRVWLKIDWSVTEVGRLGATIGSGRQRRG